MICDGCQHLTWNETENEQQMINHSQLNKKAVLSLGNRAMPQLFFLV